MALLRRLNKVAQAVALPWDDCRAASGSCMDRTARAAAQIKILESTQNPCTVQLNVTERTVPADRYFLNASKIGSNNEGERKRSCELMIWLLKMNGYLFT